MYSDIARLADLCGDDWDHMANVVLYIPNDIKTEDIAWEAIHPYDEVMNITVAIENANAIPIVQEQGYPVYWAFPATSYWELRGLLALGVAQILVDAPLFFDLPKVKSICGSVKLRVVVNKCYNNYMPRLNGICGTYVRPEDVDYYSTYVDHMEFDTDNDLKKERILWKIYSEDKNWPGNLNLLLSGLGANIDNRGLNALPTIADEKPTTFAEMRIGCGQRCQSTQNCHFCESIFRLVNTIDKNKDWLKVQLDESK